MNNKIEKERPGIHMMTQFSKGILEQRLLELDAEVKLHSKEMGEAVSKGDEYHDNFAYEDATRLRNQAAQMLSETKQKLYDVAIIEPRQEVDMINVGNTVVVRFAGEIEDEKFTVLGPDDAKRKPDWISYESPLGVLLLGKKSGDQIEYHVPTGNPQKIIVKQILPGAF